MWINSQSSKPKTRYTIKCLRDVRSSECFEMNATYQTILIIFLLVFMSLSGCISNEESSDAMVLATTTSMRDSGLLDELIPLSLSNMA